MSLQDFERCTPQEFSEVVRCWREVAEHEGRRSWEQARFIAVATLTPYREKAIEATDVVRFPWDDETKGAPAKPSTPERRKEIIARVMKANRGT